MIYDYFEIVEYLHKNFSNNKKRIKIAFLNDKEPSNNMDFGQV